MFSHAQPCLGRSPLTFGLEWDLDTLIRPNICRLRRQATRQQQQQHQQGRAAVEFQASPQFMLPRLDRL